MNYKKTKSLKITKAVIPAAGFGTRFLPITKGIPKEMMPLVDKPIIQIVVEELVEAGITDIIFVVNKYKKAFQDYFSPFPELEEKLKQGGKEKELAEVNRLNHLANFHYVEQLSLGKGGTGVAILSGEKYIDNEPFLVLWADDFIVAQPSRTRQLLAAFEKYQGTIFSCFKRPEPQWGKLYGFCAGKEIADGVLEVTDLVEKPGEGKQPSPYAIVSGFVFLPSIFNNLRTAVRKFGSEREIYYNVDGVLPSLGKEKAYALEIKNGQYFDTGNKLEYLKTVVEFGLKNEELGQKFREFLTGIV